MRIYTCQQSDFTNLTAEEIQQEQQNNLEAQEYENWKWTEDMIKLADEIEKNGEVRLI